MATKLTDYLNNIPGLTTLAERLARVQELQRLYNTVAPDYLTKATRIADVNGNTLIIIAFNGVAASGLKQRLPTLLATFQTAAPEISVVQVQVQVENLYTAPQQKASRTLSLSGAKSLRGLAERLADSPLRKALQRLARGSDQYQPFDQVNQGHGGEQNDKKAK